MTVTQAKAAYVRGHIDVEEFEQRISDVLDGTEAKRQQARAQRHCAEHGHTMIERFGGINRRSCARCAKPWTEEEPCQSVSACAAVATTPPQRASTTAAPSEGPSAPRVHTLAE